MPPAASSTSSSTQLKNLFGRERTPTNSADEAFFKALKQNLKIKTFVGTSANAVKTQIWTALISMLLLRYLQLCSRFGWSLANLVALLRMNLFTHRDLMAWLDQPFATPPDPQDNPQAALAFA